MSKKGKPPVHVKQNKDAALKKGNSSISSALSDKLFWVLLGIAVLVFSYIRLRLSPMPLERDEGEYAYMGKIILDGFLPYKEAYNMKLPGTYFMYAFIELIFGKTFQGIHIGLWVFNLFTVALLFLSIKKLFSPLIALLTASMFGFMSVSYNFLGFAAHATHFVAFFVSLALFFFAKYSDNKKWLLSGLTGLMFGMAFLMKQQAVFFILFGGIMILIYELSEKPLKISKAILNILSYSVFVCIPYLLVVLLMVANGAFDKFWFWTYQYASKYISQVTMSTGYENLKMTFDPIWGEYKFFWIFFFLGIITVWLSRFKVQEKIFAFLFIVFAFLTTCPGFYFRQHYFISLIPAAALFSAISIDSIFYYFSLKSKVKSMQNVSILVFALIIIAALNQNSFYYFKKKPEPLCRMIYGGNPFTESLQIAKYINQNSAPTDKIAVLGSEPQIMFYANRKSATGYLYTYNMMEIHDYNKQMQHEMISEIEKEKPLYIVYCNIRFSWLGRTNSPKDIFEWSQKYTTTNYQVVGLVDIVSNTSTNYYWDADANRQPEGKEYVLVYKRKV